MTYSTDKVRISTKMLARAQLLIYYPIVICVGYLYHPSYVCDMLEKFFLNFMHMHFDGLSAYMLIVAFLANVLAIVYVFKFGFPPSKCIYEGKNGWHSVWWSFGIQTAVLMFGLNFILIEFYGIMKGIISFNIRLLSYSGGAFFLGTIGTYSFLQLINKIINFRGK